jgi:O-antigen/teichoic acid export membrane protein
VSLHRFARGFLGKHGRLPLTRWSGNSHISIGTGKSTNSNIKADTMVSAYEREMPGTRAEDDVESAVSNMFGRGSLYTLAFASQALVNVLMTPVITRSLGPSQFGNLAAVLAVGQVIQTVASLGLNVGIQRHFADDDSGQESRGIIVMAVFVGIAISLLLFATLPLWARSLGYASDHDALTIGVWWSGLSAISVTMSALLRSQDRLKAFLLVVAMQAVGGQLIGLALILGVKRTATYYLTGLLVGQGLGALVCSVLVRPRFDRATTLRVTGRVLKFSLPLVPHLLAGLVLNVGDRIVVRRDLGLAAVGRYQLAYNAAGTFILLLLVLNQAWEPRIYAVKTERVRMAVLANSRDQLYYLEVPVIIGMTLAAPIVLRILGPPSFEPRTLLMVFSLVVLSALPYAAYLANLRTIMAYRNTAYLAWITPTCAGINIVLNLILVPHFGIDGSAFATLLSFGLLAVATGVVGRRSAILARTSWHIWIALGLASGTSLLLVSAPATSTLALSLRFSGAVVCGIWGALGIRRVVKGTSRTKKLELSEKGGYKVVELALFGPRPTSLSEQQPVSRNG